MKIGDLVVIKKSAIKHYRRKDFNLAAENETPVLILAVNEYTITGFYSGGGQVFRARGTNNAR